MPEYTQQGPDYHPPRVQPGSGRPVADRKRVADVNAGPTNVDEPEVRVPLGVILMIYEARPNVTADAAALCLKSANPVILRGGREALAGR